MSNNVDIIYIKLQITHSALFKEPNKINLKNETGNQAKNYSMGKS